MDHKRTKTSPDPKEIRIPTGKSECKIRSGKREYKRKVEEKFSCGDVREARRGLDLMMGRAQEEQNIQCNDPAV